MYINELNITHQGCTICAKIAHVGEEGERANWTKTHL